MAKLLSIVALLTAPAVIVTPPALLVPNDTRIVLSCQPPSDLDSDLSIQWYMNRTTLITKQNRDFYHHDPDWEDNIHKIEFNATVTASLNVNNTNFSCLIDNDSGRLWSNDVSLAILTSELFIWYSTFNGILISHVY